MLMDVQIPFTVHAEHSCSNAVIMQARSKCRLVKDREAMRIGLRLVASSPLYGMNCLLVGDPGRCTWS